MGRGLTRIYRARGGEVGLGFCSVGACKMSNQKEQEEDKAVLHGILLIVEKGLNWTSMNGKKN